MKRLFAIAFALALTVHLATAQAANNGGTDKTSTPAANHKAKPAPAAEKPATAQDKVSLNPQPLPPGAKSKTVNPADKVALNPQPLPPKEKSKTVNPSDKVALNPQPLPPKEMRKAGGDPSSKVELNPQPLPPRTQPSTAAKKKTNSQPTEKIDKASPK